MRRSRTKSLNGNRPSRNPCDKAASAPKLALDVLLQRPRDHDRFSIASGLNPLSRRDLAKAVKAVKPVVRHRTAPQSRVGYATLRSRNHTTRITLGVSETRSPGNGVSTLRWARALSFTALGSADRAVSLHCNTDASPSSVCACNGRLLCHGAALFLSRQTIVAARCTSHEGFACPLILLNCIYSPIERGRSELTTLSFGLSVFSSLISAS